MVQYTCKRCGYTTKHKGSFVNHLNRKNICQVLLDDISIEEMKNWYNLNVNKNVTVLEQKKTVLEQEKPVCIKAGKNQPKPAFQKTRTGKNQEKPAFLEKKKNNL